MAEIFKQEWTYMYLNWHINWISGERYRAIGSLLFSFDKVILINSLRCCI